MLRATPQKEKRKNDTKKNKKRGATAGLATLHANEEEVGQVDEWEECEPLPPLFVYFDIEARQDQGEHVANLLCAERDDSDQCEVFKGETCVEEFLDWLRKQTKTDDPEGKRQVIAVAHNFQGYNIISFWNSFTRNTFAPIKLSMAPKF